MKAPHSQPNMVSLWGIYVATDDKGNYLRGGNSDVLEINFAPRKGHAYFNGVIYDYELIGNLNQK